MKEFKNEIHENIQILVNQAEKIKNNKKEISFFTHGFETEIKEIPQKVNGIREDTSNILLNLNLQNPSAKERKKIQTSPSSNEKMVETTKKIPIKPKYDFYQLNKQRWGVIQNNIMEVQKLPKEIDNIYQMKGEVDANLLRSIPLNFSEKRKIHAMIEDPLYFLSNEDEIHTFSCVYEPLEEDLKEANNDFGIPYYLHLSSLSRELVFNRKIPEDDAKYDQKVLDFLSEKEYQISHNNLHLDDYFNILSGRISDKILLRLINGQEIHPLFEDFSEENNINIPLPFENNDSYNKKDLKKKNEKSAISQDLVKLSQNKLSTRVRSSVIAKTPTFTSKSLQEIYEEIGYPIDQLQHEIIEMNNLVQNNFSSWQDTDFINTNKIQIGLGGLNKIDEEDETSQEKKKKMILGDNKRRAVGIQVDVGNEEKSESDLEVEKKSEEDDDESKKSVNILLKEITDLKDAKRNSMNMVNSQVMMRYIAEINSKIETRLKTLLNFIMEKDIDEIYENKEKEERKIEKSGEVINTENLQNNLVFTQNNNEISNIKKPISDSSLNASSKRKISIDKNEDESDILIVEDEVELKRIKEREKMKEDLKKNLKLVVKDIDKLQGKFIDGHLKTKLLFQFLKEYRKLKEENRTLLTEMEESILEKDEVENPFNQNLKNALEKENQETPQRFKRMEKRTPAIKNPNVTNKGWDINKNQVKNKYIHLILSFIEEQFH